MGRQSEEKNAPESERIPLYTVRQPPLIQPLRLSVFTQKTCSQYGIPSEDLAHEWVILFKAISEGKMGDGMQLHIPDTVLLSPSGHPSVWYTTSAAGRIKAKGLMRVSPQSIFEAFQAPLTSRCQLSACADDTIALRRLGFEMDTVSRQQLKVLCSDMELPSVCLPLAGPSRANSVRSGLIKRVFCLQRHIPRQNNVSFLIVWRHSSVLPSSEQPESTGKSPHLEPRNDDRSMNSNTGTEGSSNPCTPRAHSDVFLLAQPKMQSAGAESDNTEYSGDTNETHNRQKLIYLDIERPGDCIGKTLRRGGFDPDVMAPLLFCMKRVTSEIANCINLGHSTRQACGLACEFFVSEHNGSVYFSALRGIQWTAGLPSWKLVREFDPLSRSLCEFYDSNVSNPRGRRRGPSSPQKPRSPSASDIAMYYEQNPRFPSVVTPFAGEKQWLHRSQLVAPGNSPRYIGASVPKIYRDGVFQSLLTSEQADSVVRLNLSPQAPSTLAEVRRKQPHIVTPRRHRTKRSIPSTSNESVEDSSIF